MWAAVVGLGLVLLAASFVVCCVLLWWITMAVTPARAVKVMGLVEVALIANAVFVAGGLFGWWPLPSLGMVPA